MAGAFDPASQSTTVDYPWKDIVFQSDLSKQMLKAYQDPTSSTQYSNMMKLFGQQSQPFYRNAFAQANTSAKNIGSSAPGVQDVEMLSRGLQGQQIQQTVQVARSLQESIWKGVDNALKTLTQQPNETSVKQEQPNQALQLAGNTIGTIGSMYGGYMAGAAG